MLKNIEKYKKTQTKKRVHLFRECIFTKTQLMFLTKYQLIYANPLYQKVLIELYSAELILKNIEKCKTVQTKKRFHIFVSARLQKRN